MSKVLVPAQEPCPACGTYSGVTIQCNLVAGHSGPHNPLDALWAEDWDKREMFKTGAHRSATTAGADAPTDYSQLSHVALRLMAETQAEGNKKYGYGNWQKGIPVSNLLSHALAHILALINGDNSENHYGHALWNLEKAAHFTHTRPDLVDIPVMRKALGLDPEAVGSSGGPNSSI